MEAAAFGKPTVALRAGGYLDTVVDNVTGVYADAVTAAAFDEAIFILDASTFDPAAIRAHAEHFSLSRFLDDVAGHVAAVVG